MTAYIISYGIAQLPFGPLSDSLGRKPIMLFGILLFLYATTSALFSPSIEQFLIARVLQGIAMGAINSPCRALLPDTFTGDTYKRMASTMTLAWAMEPIVAPVLGSQLQHHFGWKAPLWFLLGYGALILLLLMILPETHPKMKWTAFREFSKHGKSILLDRQFLSYLLIITFLYSVLLLFNIVGPFLIQTTLHYSATAYGFLSLLMGVAWLSGNLINRFTVQWPIQKKIATGLVVNSGLSLAAILLFSIQPLSIHSLVPILFVLILCSGYMFPNGFGFCLSVFPKASGATSAIMGTLLITGAGLVTILGSLLSFSSAIPLLSVYLAGFAVSYVIVRRQALYKKTARLSVHQDF